MGWGVRARVGVRVRGGLRVGVGVSDGVRGEGWGGSE